MSFATSLARLRYAVSTRNRGLDSSVCLVKREDLQALLEDWTRYDYLVRDNKDKIWPESKDA